MKKQEDYEKYRRPRNEVKDLVRTKKQELQAEFCIE